MSPDPAAILDRIIGAALDCGEVAVEASDAEHRLTAAGVEFATVKVRPQSVELYLTLPGGRRLPGIVKLLSGASDVARHRLRLRSAEDVDDQVRAWLCEAYEGATG